MEKQTEKNVIKLHLDTTKQLPIYMVRMRRKGS